MHISDEQLIAYLLGDASDELRAQIESCLGSDHDLADRLQEFRLLLGHMDSLTAAHEPPCDLIQATWDRIDSAISEQDLGGQQSDADHSIQEAGFAKIPVSSLRPLQPDLQASSRRRSLWDSSVLALSLLMLCCLLLPAVVQVRSGARRNQCADNLRTIGWDLVSYALGDPESRFPVVGSDELTGFAGIFPVRLKSAGYAISYSQLQCPSLVGCTEVDPPLQLATIPTLAELSEIDPGQLGELKLSLAGDYAYNLGVTEGEQAVAPRYEGRAHFAILSDSPVFEAARERMIAHGGAGANFFFEDGRVAFVRVEERKLDEVGDYPFRNLVGRHAAGVTPSDISLAPSHFPTSGD